MTLHQLRILWAVAHAQSLTRASKQLGLAQPSLSQQLSRLEEAVGVQLFDRTRNQLQLTDAGKYLLRMAERILADADEALAGLKQFTDGARGAIAVGTLNSVARILLPRVLAATAQQFPGIELDVHEVSPGEALDMLYGRQLSVVILADNSIARDSVSYPKMDVCTDPYALAVPRGLDLSRVRDPKADLDDEARAVLNSCIQFNFGTRHTNMVEQWYRQALPDHRLIGQTRAYEVALSMVQAGNGVALVPTMTAMVSPDRTFDVTLYRVDLRERHLVALVPAQYQRVEPYRTFLRHLGTAGHDLRLPAMEATPPFLVQSEHQAVPAE